uniref:Uncharacterized protein n=1 Tax=Panagrolaimus sp. PS1159 TaxID=55785 RepID=A0AC35F2Z8_9BILA
MVAELKFTPNGYKLVKHEIMRSLNSKENPEILFQKICGSSTPQKIIAATINCKAAFKKIFKSKNVTFLNVGAHIYYERFIVETVKWFFDKSFIKYYILPISSRNIRIYGYYGTAKNILDIIYIQLNDPLPVKKAVYYSKSIPQLHVMFNESTHTYGYQHELSKNCHGYQTTVTIDEENFEIIETKSYCFNAFKKVLSQMNTLLNPKIPFIGFYDNSSVIGICKNSEEGYQFLEEWNDMFGNECFISFDQKRPKFGQSASNSLKTKNTFVVFDLLNIMSMAPEKIKIDKTWGFTFTKNEDNPVLLKFDYFDGTKKCSSPSFLMAIFLRQHLKAIESKIGQKPEKVAFWIIDRKFNESERKRIENGLKKSCKLLKINCIFVNLESISIDSRKFNNIGV